MDSGLVTICVIILIIFVLIYIVKNNQEIKKKIDELREKRKYKIVYCIGIIILIGVFAFYFKEKIEDLKENIDYSIQVSKNNTFFENWDEEIAKENEFYRSVFAENQSNYNDPYILNGFRYVGGEWNTGFMIEDESGNQYVWVPTPRLIKKDFIINANIQKEYCLDDDYEDFMRSVSLNGGFYISRYETRNRKWKSGL